MKFRFSIRDLLWLTALVAVLLAWWIDHRKVASRNRFTVETIQRDGEPIVLRDNVTGDVLVKRGYIWKTGSTNQSKAIP
jgi:hypothetical protein